MISRTFNADFITSVIEHPSVMGGARAWKGIDLKPVADNLNNFILVNDSGGFVVIKVSDDTYECHTQFLPEGRGVGVRDAVHEALDYMFINTDCERLITKSYKDNPASIKLSDEFFREAGDTADYRYYEMLYSDWVCNDKNLQEGAEFHKLVADDTNHDDDVMHDYHVGAAVRIAKAGNYAKAQNLYNRWALMSGYELIKFIRECPPLATIGDMTLELINNEVRVCQ